MYVATVKNKWIPAGVKIDIDEWLREGWIIKKGKRFISLDELKEIICEVTELPRDEFFNTNSFESDIARKFFYFFSIYTASQLTEIADYCKTGIDSVLIARKSIDHMAEKYVKIGHYMKLILFKIEKIINI